MVCPTTLGGHWLEEVTKFVSRQHLDPFLYLGNPTDRASLRSQVKAFAIIPKLIQIGDEFKTLKVIE